MKDYTEYIVEQTQKLLSIDSPTGYTKNVAAYLSKLRTAYRKTGKSAIPLPDRFSLKPMWIHWGQWYRKSPPRGT